MRNALKWALPAAGAVLLALRTLAAEPPSVPARTSADVPDGFTFAAVGDLLETRPVMPLADPAFLTIDGIIRRADVAFGNGEIPIVDVTAPGIYPAAENGALNAFGVPTVAADLRAQGFAMVSRANNHSTDWGVAGMLMTDAFLDRAGIVHAGTGRDDDAARRVRFLETRWGRVGLAATTSTFEGNEPAGAAMGDVPGRPGASVVHTQQSTVIDRSTLDGLKRYYSAPVYHIDDTVGADTITVYGQSFVVGPQPGIHYEMDKHDVAAIVRAVRQGNALSNFLVFSTHCHEDASGIGNDVPQGGFLRDLAHAVIDAGADVFVGHGPHQVAGIEIYKGKPIFYSLGNYIFQLGAQENVYPEAYLQFGMDPSKYVDADVMHHFLEHYFREEKWWQSIVAVVSYRRGAASEIRLYPIELRRDRPEYAWGLPAPATPQEARAILQRIARLSRPYGTSIEIDDGIGVIRLR